MHVPAVPLFRDATGMAVALTAWAHHRCLQLYLFIYLFYFFSRFWGVLGPLTYTKTLENWHTCWNLRPLGRRRGWEPGVAQGLYGAPWKTVRKQMYISHILAHIHMKLGTHIDLIELNKFHAACHRFRPTGSRLFRAV